mgnify:CR=1 FL=1
MRGLDGGEQGSEPLVGEMPVLAALQDKGAETRLKARLTGGKDLFRGETITLGSTIRAAQTAIVAIVSAVVLPG